MSDSKTRIYVLARSSRGMSNLISHLTGVGFEIHRFPGSKKFCSAVSEGHADLLLLDLGARDADLLDLVKNAIPTDSPHRSFSAVLLHSRSQSGLVVKALEEWADAAIRKPFDVGSVASQLQAILRTRKILHSTNYEKERLTALH